MYYKRNAGGLEPKKLCMKNNDMQGFRDNAFDNKCDIKIHTNDLAIEDCHRKGKSNKNHFYRLCKQKEPQGSDVLGKIFDLSRVTMNMIGLP